MTRKERRSCCLKKQCNICFAMCSVHRCIYRQWFPRFAAILKWMAPSSDEMTRLIHERHRINHEQSSSTDKTRVHAWANLEQLQACSVQLCISLTPSRIDQRHWGKHFAASDVMPTDVTILRAFDCKRKKLSACSCYLRCRNVIDQSIDCWDYSLIFLSFCSCFVKQFAIWSASHCLSRHAFTYIQLSYRSPIF